MSLISYNSLRYLDQAIGSNTDLNAVKKIIDLTLRCQEALSEGLNFATVINDEANQDFILKTFQSRSSTVLQIITRIVLQNYYKRSITLTKDISGDRKVGFLYKSVGSWKQFDSVVEFFHPERQEILLVNPLEQSHWKRVEKLYEDTIVCIYINNTNRQNAESQCELALDRYEVVFDTVQNVEKDVMETTSNRAQGFSGEADSRIKKVKKKPSKAAAKKSRPARGIKVLKKTSGEMVKALRFKINKQDTFIHAGNAQLIISHLRNYDGSVKFYVLRGDKEEVRLDADSIWTKEIRNGEEVLYEFYGNQEPDESFLSELIMKTNKYTQADKF